jgi:transposase-like protein
MRKTGCADKALTLSEQYPQIIKSWRDNWDNVATLFQCPPDIRKAIYTTNAIESLNSVIRKATKQCNVSPTIQSAMKVVYAAISAASKKWTRAANCQIQSRLLQVNTHTLPTDQ